MAGRPTSLSDELIEKAEHYISGGWEECGDKIPSIAGLACEIGVHRETIRLWAKDEENPFFGIHRRLMQAQERTLVNNGLAGTYNPAITKLILTKHDYSDRIEQDHSSKDGTMTPKGLDVSGLSTEALQEIMAASDASEQD